jgi:hypothetical protein
LVERIGQGGIAKTVSLFSFAGGGGRCRVGSLLTASESKGVVIGVVIGVVVGGGGGGGIVVIGGVDL